MNGIMQRFSLGARIGIGLVFAMLGTMAVLAIPFLVENGKLVEREESDRARAQYNNMLISLQGKAAAAADMATLIAQSAEAKAAMVAHDRERLMQMYGDSFKYLKKEQGFKQFHFHGPDNVTIYRVHKPKLFGDDLTNIRRDVARSNQSKKPVLGLSSGKSGIGLRGVVPAFIDGRHIGAVEVGRDLDANFVSDFKASYGVDSVIHLQDKKGGFTTYSGTTESVLSSEELKAALGGEPVRKRVAGSDGHALVYAREILDSLDNPIGVIELKMDNGMNVTAQRRMYTAVAVALVLAAGFVAVLLIILYRQVARPLNVISSGLHEGARQVSSSSDEVASGGQDLADGATQQAASLEETSASLEEISTMTRQNADNASMADNLMREANTVVKRAGESMSELTASMRAINEASEETSKIIKTIDEIAFQTNLLALNAAVEAARAGEAGAGFAVVADEVRNLAMRAAEAAKNTAELIDGTVKRVGEGSALVDRTNSAFSEVAESAGKAASLVGEIAAASNEQAQGIGQLNKAMGQMDEVVQRTAASAEESAAAAEELSAMAAQMDDYVRELLLMVNGSNTAPEEGRREVAVR